MPLNNFDLIVFDMDGTLIDSMGCLEDWIYRAIKDHSAPSVNPAAVTAAFGPTEQRIIEAFVPADRAAACLDAYYALYEAEHGRVVVYPGVDELLRQIRQRGIPMALCTGKSRRATEISLARLGWKDHFKFIVTGDDMARFKPDPDGLDQILSRGEFERSRSIFVGDTVADIAAAANAGMLSGHALWCCPGPLPAGAPKPTYEFPTPQRLLSLLIPGRG